MRGFKARESGGGARVPTWLWLAIFLAPLLTGVAGRLATPHHWFADYEAVACASQHALLGEPFYSLHLTCPGMRATVFVYPPVVAIVGAWFLKTFGASAAAGLYGAAYWDSVGLLLWAALAAREGGSLRARSPFLALVSGGSVFWGNIAVIVHGAVAAAALLLGEAPWALVLVIATAAAIKPIFLTYLAIPLLAPGSWRGRLTLCVAGLVLGLAPTARFMLAPGGEAAAWRGLLDHFVLETTPGVSFLGWLSAIGSDLHGPAPMAAWLGFAATLTGAARVIAERGGLSGRGRVWLGLTVAALLNPRLMSQDLLLLGPGMVAAAEALGRRERGLTAAHAQRAYGAVCAACAILTLLGGRAGQELATAAFSLALVGIGLTLARRAARPATWWAEPRTSPTSEGGLPAPIRRRSGSAGRGL